MSQIGLLLALLLTVFVITFAATKNQAQAAPGDIIIIESQTYTCQTTWQDGVQTADTCQDLNLDHQPGWDSCSAESDYIGSIDIDGNPVTGTATYTIICVRYGEEPPGDGSTARKTQIVLPAGSELPFKVFIWADTAQNGDKLNDIPLQGNVIEKQGQDAFTVYEFKSNNLIGWRRWRKVNGIWTKEAWGETPG